MTNNRPLKQALEEYLPEGCTGMVLDWFASHRVTLRITKSRRTKLGDFRNRGPLVIPVISVNHDLNPYSFLVTLLHEMAHAEIHLNQKKRIQPHGKEWKLTYQRIANPFLTLEKLDPGFKKVFELYLKNPSASSMAHLPLARMLRSFDKKSDIFLIGDIPENSYFALPDGRVFRKGGLLRKRFRCECLNNKRVYLFNPMAEISPLQSNAEVK
ncbi:MAG: SprT-like domain-containing protein [Lentimicrobium sp.]|nr:SprT-like domain-containing protein [Lentimicrobium sp.]